MGTYNSYYGNPYFNAFYNYGYNAYNPYTFGAYPYAYPTAAPVTSLELEAPVVKAADLPAPVAALPAPYVAAPVVRAPIVEPVVVEKAKKVTYTHLGAHPLVNPATILEKTGELEVVGHRVY